MERGGRGPPVPPALDEPPARSCWICAAAGPKTLISGRLPPAGPGEPAAAGFERGWRGCGEPPLDLSPPASAPDSACAAGFGFAAGVGAGWSVLPPADSPAALADCFGLASAGVDALACLAVGFDWAAGSGLAADSDSGFGAGAGPAA